MSSKIRKKSLIESRIDEFNNFYNLLYHENKDYEKINFSIEEKEETMLFSYLSNKLKVFGDLNEKEFIVYNDLREKYHKANTDYFGLLDLKYLSNQFKNYPERKYNNLIVSHTLKEKKFSLIPLVGAFISAYDIIKYYHMGVIKLMSGFRGNYINFNRHRELSILSGILKKGEDIYHEAFVNFYKYLDGNNYTKNKHYMLLEHIFDDINNHKIIKDIINIANDLSYVALQSHTQVNMGEVGASPGEIKSRESFLSQEDISDLEEKDVPDEYDEDEVNEDKTRLSEKESDEESNDDDIEVL